MMKIILLLLFMFFISCGDNDNEQKADSEPSQSASDADTAKAIADLTKQIADLKSSPQNTSDTSKIISSLTKQIANLKPSPLIADLAKQLADLKLSPLTTAQQLADLTSSSSNTPADSTVFLQCQCLRYIENEASADWGNSNPIIGSGKNQSEALQDVNNKCQTYVDNINEKENSIYNVRDCAAYSPSTPSKTE